MHTSQPGIFLVILEGIHKSQNKSTFLLSKTMYLAAIDDGTSQSGKLGSPFTVSHMNKLGSRNSYKGQGSNDIVAASHILLNEVILSKLQKIR